MKIRRLSLNPFRRTTLFNDEMSKPLLRSKTMNTLQILNPYDNATSHHGLSVSEMISSGVYKVVQLIERSVRGF